jgi:hypothetical protein
VTEDGFWKELRAVLPRGHFTRVENLVQPGTPDVNFCVGRIEGWMELKHTDKFPLEHPVLMTQDLWIEQHRRAGGRVGICVGYRDSVFFVIDAFGVAINDWAEKDFIAGSLVAHLNPHDIERSFRAWVKLLKPPR